MDVSHSDLPFIITPMNKMRVSIFASFFKFLVKRLWWYFTSKEVLKNQILGANYFSIKTFSKLLSKLLIFVSYLSIGAFF